MKRLCILLLILFGSQTACAVVTIYFQNSDSDVIAYYEGTLDLTGLTFLRTDTTPFIFAQPNIPIFLNLTGDNYNTWDGATFQSYGTAGLSAPSAAERSAQFGIGSAVVSVGVDFVSGSTLLSGSLRFPNTTVESMGIIDDLIVSSWEGDYVIVKTPQAVPEPGVFSTLIGLAALIAVGSGRRRIKKFT